MALRHLLSCSSDRSRPHARAPTVFVAGVAALVAFAPAAAAGAASAGPDADCDGIVNAIDNCPTDVEDRDGHLDADGCPDPDNDGDVIADAADGCPDEAETYNDFEDRDGCPDAAIVLMNDRIELKQRIQFAFDTSEILARSRPMLGEIAQAVRQHPEIGLFGLRATPMIRVRGDTIRCSPSGERGRWRPTWSAWESSPLGWLTPVMESPSCAQRARARTPEQRTGGSSSLLTTRW